MKITKYEHACLVVEENGQRLVIDPGAYTTSLPTLSNVAGIVITHVHPDHFDKANLIRLTSDNPGVKIFTVSEVAANFPEGKDNLVTVNASDSHKIGNFNLRFYGGQHAIIHKSYPVAENVGVMINDILFYPGDSFVDPQFSDLKVLALPVSAPWMKLGEAMDYLLAVKPKIVFPTHNALLSDIGQSLVDRMLANVNEGTSYKVLQTGESLSVS